MSGSVEFRPQHRLFVAFSRSADTDAEVRVLGEHGIATEAIWRLAGKAGLVQLDVSGAANGMWARVTRLLQRTMSADFDYLESLEHELRDEHVVLAVPAEDAKAADRLAALLKLLGGHEFAYFAIWTSSRLQPEGLR